MKLFLKSFINSFFGKLLLDFVLIAVLPTTFLFYFSFNFFSTQIRQNEVEKIYSHISKITSQIGSDISGIYDIIENFDVYIEQDKNIFDLVNQLQSEKIDRVSQYLGFYLGKSSSIENIIVVDKNYNWKFASRNEKYINPNYDFKKFFNFMRADSEEQIAVSSLHTQDYFNQQRSYVISFLKEFYSEGKYCGTLIIDMNVEYLQDKINEIAIIGTKECYVLNSNNYCFFSNMITYIDETYRPENIPIFISKDALLKSVNCPKFYIKSEIENSDWTVYAYFDSRELFDYLIDLRDLLLFGEVIIFILLLFIAIRFSYGITSPIKKMVLKINEIKKGDLSVVLEENRSNELREISATINEMTKSLNEYIEKEYAYKLRQKEDEFNALKMQIKPHYLYNTLEIIRMTANENDCFKVSSMIKSLSMQMRYILDDTDSIVPISKEIQILDSYFELVEMRYEGQIKFTKNIDENLMGYGIQKVILQPIFENSIKHGYDEEKEVFEITLRGMLFDDKIELSIFDNGVGIDMESIENIQSTLNDSVKLSGSEIGLKSIHDRIRLYYGEPYGLEIESSKGIGTLVKITIPRIVINKF